jgi:DNA-binding transcriptional regulator LsrR (DeoR family)/transcriptional regulator with XRE-family HTH domain
MHRINFEESFGCKLRQMRERRGLTQRELGQRLGIGNASISLWESGTRVPTVTHLYLLCKALQFSADELLSLQRTARLGSGGDLEWSIHTPHTDSLNYGEGLLDGIRLFEMIAANGMSPEQIRHENRQYAGFNDSRMEAALKTALLTGCVELVSVVRDKELEAQLSARYGLLHCLVAKLEHIPDSTVIESTIHIEAVAHLAATHCPQLIAGLENIGVGGGIPVARFLDLVPPGAESLLGITWWSLLATKRHISFSPPGVSANSIISRVLNRQSKVRGHTMPFINAERRTNEHFQGACGEEHTELEYARFVQRRAAQVDAAFITCGVPDVDYIRYDAELGMPELIQLLEGLSPKSRATCTGDVLLRLLDAQGTHLGSPQEQSANEAIVYGVSLEDLQSMVNKNRQVWLLASRSQKAGLLRSALEGGIVNCLVITNRIAEMLLG